jgi:hypothetical protein
MGGQRFFFASQLHQADDLVRGDLHGVGERAPGRTFAALVASVDVLPDHFADSGSKNSRLVI